MTRRLTAHVQYLVEDFAYGLFASVEIKKLRLCFVDTWQLHGDHQNSRFFWPRFLAKIRVATRYILLRVNIKRNVER